MPMCSAFHFQLLPPLLLLLISSERNYIGDFNLKKALQHRVGNIRATSRAQSPAHLPQLLR
jgi:hypothetical protein